jgi:Flp pilus assembly protein TadG
MGRGMRWVKKWWFGTDGATAVEFSLLALPFVVMIIGTIEIALMFTTQSLLDASTSTAARLIRTGQIQQSDAGDQEQLFRDTLCDFASILIPCGEIQFQVDNLDSFGDADGAPPPTFDEDGNLQNQGFSPGGVSDVVLIRVAYKYSIITPLMQFVLTNRGDGSRLMMSTIVLQTEPYEFEDD